MPDALRVATAMSAVLAATGAWRGSRVAKLQAYWPVPVMVFAVALVARDLALILGPRNTNFSFFSLAMAAWAGGSVLVAGAIELRGGRRPVAEGVRLIAPALLVASGSAMLLYYAETPSSANATGLATGVLVLLSGVLLVALRTMERPASVLRLLWPAALLAGALTPRPSEAPDALAEAGREMDIVLSGLRRAGARVLPVEAEAGIVPFARGPVRIFRVDGNEVQIYLVAHDDDSSPEAHLLPRAPGPSSIGGVPHLHIGPHILVLCVTADPSFARQLDSIVHGLGGQRPRGSFTLTYVAPQLGLSRRHSRCHSSKFSLARSSRPLPCWASPLGPAIPDRTRWTTRRPQPRVTRPDPGPSPFQCRAETRA